MNFEIPDAVFFSNKIRPEARLVWAYLNKVNDVSLAIIAQELQINRRSIIRYMKTLEKAGFVKVSREPGKQNEYKVMA